MIKKGLQFTTNILEDQTIVYISTKNAIAQNDIMNMPKTTKMKDENYAPA